MRKLGAAIVILCAVPLWTMWAQQTSKAAKVEELFRLMKTEQTMQQSLAQMRNVQQMQISRIELAPEARARQQEIMDAMNKVILERLSWEKIRPRFVEAMSGLFTDQELDGLLTFYRSPTGKAMVDKLPQFMMASMTIVQEQMRDLGPEFNRIVEEAKQKKQ